MRRTALPIGRQIGLQSARVDGGVMAGAPAVRGLIEAMGLAPGVGVDGEAMERRMGRARCMKNRGVFVVDVQGLSGSKKEYKYFPIKGIKYVSYESAGSFDMDADIKIGVDGNSMIVNGQQHSIPLSFKIPKAQAAEGESFFKPVKNALDSRHQ
jgi:Bacterial PH domain